MTILTAKNNYYRFHNFDPYIINTAIILTANEYFNEQNLLMGIMSLLIICVILKEQIDYSQVILQISEDKFRNGPEEYLELVKNISRC